MDRPLWQIVLAFLLLFFAVQRGAVAAAGYLASGAPALTAAYAGSALASIVAALGIWLGRGWARGAVVALGIAVVATALLQGATFGAAAFPGTATEVILAALGTGALVMVLGRECGKGPDEGGPT
jgi:membrane protease YdiL (CAAX protease family)